MPIRQPEPSHAHGRLPRWPLARLGRARSLRGQRRPWSARRSVASRTRALRDLGTQPQPFRTITRAIATVLAGQTIQVAPGTYDAALGETFPLLLPPGTALLGDELTKGNGSTPTRIEGGGAVPPPNAPPGMGTL